MHCCGCGSQDGTVYDLRWACGAVSCWCTVVVYRLASFANSSTRAITSHPAWQWPAYLPAARSATNIKAPAVWQQLGTPSKGLSLHFAACPCFLDVQHWCCVEVVPQGQPYQGHAGHTEEQGQASRSGGVPMSCRKGWQRLDQAALMATAAAAKTLWGGVSHSVW